MTVAHDFFLCSDSREAEVEMSHRFPGRIITKQKTSYVKKKMENESWRFNDSAKPSIRNIYRDKQSVIEALQDLLILTRTTFSIRSNGSFSDIAECWHPASMSGASSTPKREHIQNKRYGRNWMDTYLKYLKDFSVEYKTTKLKPISSKNNEKAGISIITACRNRSTQLMISLETWCKCEEVSEIIIVDWSSSDLVINRVEKIPDSRISVVRVESESRWILSHAFNLAARFAKFDLLCKLDADYCLHEEFFKNHKLVPGSFYSGSSRRARNSNEKHLNGFLFLHRKDFFDINGYNERIIFYGWEDTDLTRRLIGLGLNRNRIDNHYIEHISHSDSHRIQDMQANFPLRRAIEANRRLCKNERWKPKHKVRKYEIKKSGTKNFSCSPVYAPEKEQNRLILYAEQGLGSRLGALASGLAYSAQTGRKLFLHWKKSVDCDCLFEELFENRFTNPGESPAKSGEEFDESQIIRGSRVYDIRNGSDQVRLQKFDSTISSDIIIRARSRIRHRRIKGYMEEIALRQLIPRYELQKRISELDVSNMIGVHVRTEGGTEFNDNPWDSHDNWSVEETRKLCKWRTRTQPEQFFEEIDRLITTEPDVRIFLCTDRPEHYESFLNRYGALRITFTAKNRFDRSLAQLQSAVVDLYLLSKTRFILGSSFSYFSDVVQQLGGKSIKLAGQDF